MAPAQHGSHRTTGQVRDDAWTKNPEDAQKTFYNYFGRYPEKVLAFFERYMK